MPPPCAPRFSSEKRGAQSERWREREERSRLRLEKQKTGEGRVFSSSEEQTIPSLRPLLTCAKISHAVCCEVSDSRARGAAGAAGLTRRTGAPCASVPPPPPPRPMRQAQVVAVDDLDVDGCIDVERPLFFVICCFFVHIRGFSDVLLPMLPRQRGERGETNGGRGKASGVCRSMKEFGQTFRTSRAAASLRRDSCCSFLSREMLSARRPSMTKKGR